MRIPYPTSFHLPLLTLAAVTLFASAPVQGADTQARPNILLLLADNWAWPHAGNCGDKSVKTPTFAWLAKAFFSHPPSVRTSPAHPL